MNANSADRFRIRLTGLQNWRLTLLVLGISLFWILAGLLNWIPLWWDEGWTINVARNWVVNQHFGHYQLGEPVGPDLAAAWPVVAPVGLSFKLFGVGVWQARLPGAILTLLFTGSLYFVYRSVFGRKTANAQHLIMLIVIPFQVGPLFNGMQVMGEIPSMFSFFIGIACISLGLGAKGEGWPALATRLITLLAGVLSLSIAMQTKSQMPPFIIAALIGMLVVAGVRGWWRTGFALLLIVGMVWWMKDLTGSLFYNTFVSSTAARAKIEDILSISGLVLNPAIRLTNIVYALSYGSLAVFALIRATFRLNSDIFKPQNQTSQVMLRAGLYVFCITWLGWYVVLGNFFLRYLAPAVMMGGLFITEMLCALTGGFYWRGTLLNLSGLLVRGQFKRENWASLGAILLLATAFSINLIQTVYARQNYPPAPIEAVVNWIDNNTPSDAVVESFDSEFLFLLNRPYHYPPPELSVLLTRQNFMGEAVEAPYNALIADPDILVVGFYSREWHIYDDVIESGAFDLAATIGKYEVYTRNP